jgi:hypothetical protein
LSLGAVGASRIFFTNPITMSSEPSPISPASSSELPIIEACLDLIRWFVPLLQRLPRQHRFGLGDRLIGHLYHLLEQLVQARYAHAKLPILEPLKGQIVVIQLQIRLLHQFQLIELQRYEHASRLITAIAKQHSGWLSQQQHRQAMA